VKRSRYVASGAILFLVAACGSTVENSGSGQLTTNGQGLTAPGNSASSAPGTVNGGLPGGAAGAAGTNGANSSNAGTGQQTAGQTSTGSTTGAGVVEPGDGPGVTSTTINIAAAYDPDAAAADSALGAANANPGDTKAEETAVINYINSHGGVAHRKLNPIWFKASVSQDANTTYEQGCQDWTQDHKVFVLSGGSPILDQCTANAHAIGVAAGAIVLETTAQDRKYPADINLTSFTIDHSMLVTINGLARQGYFSKGAKVGVVTWDDPYYHYGISTGANPALARAGLKNVPVQYIAVPQSAGDLGATSAAAGNAVLKFRAMGIDHVILFDGPAGINNSGVLVLEWMQQANSQQYYPKYGLNSTSAFNALASDLPQKELIGSVGVDWTPPLSETQQEWNSAPIPGMGRLCLKIMKDAGQQQSAANAQAIQLAICDEMFFLKQVLDPITGPLNQQTALAAMNATGTRFTSSITFGVDLTASRHDAADLVRNMAFQTSCSCFRYTSNPYNPY